MAVSDRTDTVPERAASVSSLLLEGRGPANYRQLLNNWVTQGRVTDVEWTPGFCGTPQAPRHMYEVRGTDRGGRPVRGLGVGPTKGEAKEIAARRFCERAVC